MKTIDIEIAVMNYFNPRVNIIVPNASWGIGLHECDILVLSKNGYATEVEIKTSRSDLLAEKYKRHNHKDNLISYFYFAVPEEMKDFALKHIPERAGLFCVREEGAFRYPKIIKKAKRNPMRTQWPAEKRLKLAHLGCMRIVGLKHQIAIYER